MKLYIDCEYTDFKGELISMALVAEDGKEFYEVLYYENPSEWVTKNVIPILGKDPISYEEFQDKLYVFLMQYPKLHIIADWPDDIKYFCEVLILAPGRRMSTPPLKMSIHRVDAISEQPHNALADARGLCNFFKRKVK